MASFETAGNQGAQLAGFSGAIDRAGEAKSGTGVECNIEEGNNNFLAGDFFCTMKENLMQFIPVEMSLDFENDNETALELPAMGPDQFRRENPALSDRDLAYAYCEYLRRQRGIGADMTKPNDR